MADIKRLAKETAVYGVSSILGRFLNWCLVPLYTYVLADTAEFGVYTNIYAWTSFLLVILIYGMETGLFRFINKPENNPLTVYGTALTSLFTTSVLFVLIMMPCAPFAANFLGYPEHPEYIRIMAVVLAMDAFSSIPFAYLRYQKKSLRFALLKLFFIVMNILFNLFFLVLCPYLQTKAPHLIDWFYDPSYGVGYIFVANLLSTFLETLLLIPSIFVGKLRFDWKLLRSMLKYSLPLLLLGVVGIMNQSLDKMIYPMLVEDRAVGESQLGIYGACFKIALIMMLFTQAFRYAYEPFVFAKNKDADSRQTYADTMKYYIITALLICLGMMAYLDVIKYLIHPSYWEGLVVVPIILVSYLFQGVYFNLSFWYKLTDRTMWGSYLSTAGCIVNLVLLIVLVPRIGYVGAATASLCAYFVMMTASYFFGQKYMPINYDLAAIAKYMGLAAVIYGAMVLLKTDTVWINLLINTALLAVFVVYMIKKDLPLSAIPVVNKLIKKK